jgi:hypothetical protein
MAVTLAFVLLGGPCLHGLGLVSSSGEEETRSPVPLQDPPVWTDSFDDMGHVYEPLGGLVGVEVSGGEVHLLPGIDTGWVASSVITCPPGYRYDMVVLEADVPGTSFVDLSILNASKDASEIGFANETVPGFKLIRGTHLVLTGLNPSAYPRIRIQANLNASGSDRPRLLAWSLHYVGIEEWRDDFLGTWKMSESTGINVTNSTVEIDLRGGGLPEYEAFPPIMLAADWGSGGGDIDAFYANTQRTGYQNKVSIQGTGAHGFDFADLNDDGHLDMIVAQYGSNGGSDSDIYWGRASGTWAQSNSFTINTYFARDAGTGDFDGDGDLDIVIANGRPSDSQDSRVFINRGGSFVFQEDISFQSRICRRVGTGDFNDDGFDDIVFAEDSTSHLYYGSASGPDTTADVNFPTPGITNDVVVKDLNRDGYLDVAFTSSSGGSAPIFLGKSGGPDGTADYTMQVGGTSSGVDAGDVNGDGYIDLCYSTSSTVKIFEGRATGWSSSLTRSVTTSGPCTNVRCADIDRNGYSDIVTASSDGSKDMQVFFGKGSWPTTAGITKPGGDTANDIGIAIPKGVGLGIQGSFITEAITLPSDKKWDLMYLEGSIPQNTTMTVSVLDSSKEEIFGYTGLTDKDVDLSGITFDQLIYIKVTVKSELKNITPVLDMLTVKWMDKMTWREEFYGQAKVERLLGLDISDGELVGDPLGSTAPELVFANLREDLTYAVDSVAFRDAGGLDYLSLPPMDFKTGGGAAAVEVVDVNGDGFKDMAFAIHRATGVDFKVQSPLWLGTSVGFWKDPDHLFNTTGARDLVVADLNEDGHTDVVFAQEQDGNTYLVNSTLFWGSASGWNSTPDIELMTWGASGVEAADLDGDGLKDLVFANYRDGTSTNTDSMVFLQEATGFCGTVPSFKLQTNAARAVAVGDLDGDQGIDVVFANSFYGGMVQVDSTVYWGNAGGGFAGTTTGLPTVGAMDVKVSDLDGDSDLDIVFANSIDNTQSRFVDSYVYLNDGLGGFSATPDVMLPTPGAVAVETADLDGSGNKDLVFACQYDGTSYVIPSVVYLGNATGWSGTPDIRLPTKGASDVVVKNVINRGAGGYMSRPIVPEDPGDIGTYHTFKYTAQLGASQSAKVQIIDADTWEVLAETPLSKGTHEWSLEGAFRVKQHPSIRVVVMATGPNLVSEFGLDDLWINWTSRVPRPPKVLDFNIAESRVYRTQQVEIVVNVTDEYDPPQDLRPVVEHRLNGTGPWQRFLAGTPTFIKGSWRAGSIVQVDVPAGHYDFRVKVIDTDDEASDLLEFPNALEVLNNIPGAPEVSIEPGQPVTTSTLSARIVASAVDIESNVLSYNYTWYRDGELVEELTKDTVALTYTSKGENWTVEVRAWDGDDLGLPGMAWIVIQNAAPMPKDPLPDPEFDEDTVDSVWLNLTTAFEDLDGDPLTWTVDPQPLHLEVTIDQETGQVTLRPETHWTGWEEVTFYASDGELRASQMVTVTVLPVNDIPSIVTVDGKPVTEDPVVYNIKQGQLLTITIGVLDIEGDEVLLTVTTTMIKVDSENKELRFEPDNEAVGWMNFTLRIYDTVTPAAKTSLNFSINVENENDPMDVPRITNPVNGSMYKTNQTITLIGICEDPDEVYGQVLDFSWSSNISGHLGYGSLLAIALMEPGIHLITLSVKDPDFEKLATVEIIIKAREGPPPTNGNGGDDDDKGLPLGLIAVAVIVVLVVVGALYFVMAKQRTEEREEEEAFDEREALERMAMAARATADKMEMERRTAEAVASEGVVETEDFEEVGLESTGMGDRLLTMEAKTTAAVSEDYKSLWQEMKEEEPEVDEAAKEELRIDNLKRKYQTTISRLPYGIPSEELKGIEWTQLATILATGNKRTLPDGREVTQIEGRWYYSDPDDSSTFLKEHDAKPKEAPKTPGPAADRDELLAKLEERFILGEITTEDYRELKKKYEG